MDKLWIAGFTASMGLALAGWGPQEPPEETVEVAKKVEAKPAGRDPADALDDVYVKLRRLRAERLTDRPKALTEDAARLYRDAIKALEAGEAKKAASLSDAARELVRAVELAQGAQRITLDDPDLPPPPSRRVATRLYRKEAASKAAELPPPLPSDGEPKVSIFLDKDADVLKAKDALKAVPFRRSETFVVDGDRIRLVRPDGDVKGRDVIVERKIALELNELAEKAKGEAAKARESAVEGQKKQVEALKLDLKGLRSSVGVSKLQGEIKAGVADEIAKLKKSDVLANKIQGLGDRKLLERYVAVQGKAAGGPEGEADKGEAIEELKRAYETVSAARKASPAGEARPYLDTARDLYNAARKDAEAGRFDRAAELARASIALTKVTGLLTDTKAKAKFFRSSPTSKGEGAEAKTFVFESKGSDAEKGDKAKFEIRVMTPDKKEEPKKEETKKETKVEVRVATPETKEEPRKEPEKSEPPVEGIGVMIKFEDGKAKILELLGDGPAAKDGRLKKGDAIAGVETESGGIVGFADKAPEEISKALRGPSGSKVKIIVLPAGSSDRKVYEVERGKLALPKTDEKAPSASGKGASLPPVID